MQKISYAQNFEDIVLARVFLEIETGHYIDVGAHNPKVDSVTKYFYDMGWSGINIEPLAQEYEHLIIDRPRDINLNLCAGDCADVVEFLSVGNRTGWSTSNPLQINKLRNNTDLIQDISLVQQKTLSSIIEESEFNEFHFLKIDVEGSESNVLIGMNFKIHRPWVIIIEATEPGSKVSTYQNWESLLLMNDYDFVYTDGINRFYLANEHKELAERFGPPNAFDEFIPLVAFEYYLQFMHMKAINEDLEKKIREIYESKSWQITVPIRKLSKFFKSSL